MSLSNWPDWKLIREYDYHVQAGNRSNLARAYGQELDLRNPEQAAWYFGDCAGKLVFIPIVPEFDIESEMMGYDDKGSEVWSHTS